MAGETADRVVVELEARLAGYQRDVQQGANAFDQSMKRMQDSASRTEKAVGRVGGALKLFLASVSVAAIVGAAERGLEYASSLGEIAQQLGVSTKALQVYRYAASQVGVSNEEMDAGLRKLTTTLGKARLGAEEPIKAFDALSKVIGKDIVSTAKDAESAIPLIADALAKISNPAERAAIEVELFGRAGQKLDTLLAGGSSAINELSDAAERLGIVLSDEQIQRADETADKLSALKQVLEARIAGAVADNAAAIDSLVSSLVTLVTWAGKASLAWRDFMLAQRMKHAQAYADAAQTPQERMRGLQAVSDIADQRLHLSRAFHGEADPSIIRKPKVVGGGGGGSSVGKFLSPKAKKGPKGPSTEQLEKERIRAAYDFDREELAGKRDLLQAQSDLTDDYEARADFAKQLAELEFQQKTRSIQFDLDMMLAGKTISAAQKKEAEVRAAKAKSLADDLRVIDLQKVTNERELQRQREAQALTDAQFDAQRELLQSQEGIATTAAERRKIELQLLDLSYQQRREALRHIQDDLLPNGDFSHSKGERDRAAVDQQNLDATYGTARQGVINSTRGPLEQWMAGVPHTAAQMNEALENIAAEGLTDLKDGLAEASASWIKMGGVAGDTLRMVYTELMKLVLSKGFGQLLSLAGQTFGGGGSLGGGIKNGAVIPGKASGGHVSAGHLYRVNETGIEGFQPAGQGKIIPLGQMARAQGGGGMTVVNTVHVHANDAVLAETVRAWVAQGMQQAAVQGAIGGRTLALDRIRRANRSRLA